MIVMFGAIKRCAQSDDCAVHSVRVRVRVSARRKVRFRVRSRVRFMVSIRIRDPLYA